MSLNQIIQTLKSDVRIFVRTIEDNLSYNCYYDYKHNDYEENCMNFQLMRRTTKHKFIMYISSIKYYDDQKKCPKTGTELIAWAVNLKKKGLIKNISLEDRSQYTFPNTTVDVNLTRYQKFTSGKGWYESYGFISKVPSENKKYQSTFIKFRNNNVQNLTLFLWHLMKPFLLTFSGYIYANVNEENFKSYYRKNKDFILYSYSKLAQSSTVKCDYAVFKKIAMKLGLLYDKDTLNIYLITHFLEKNGVVPLEDEPINEDQKQWLMQRFDTKPQNKCILKSLTPGNIRKLSEKSFKSINESSDALYHIATINLILDIMENSNILFVPLHLEMPSTRKTYNKSLKRCT